MKTIKDEAGEIATATAVFENIIAKLVLQRKENSKAAMSKSRANGLAAHKKDTVARSINLDGWHGTLTARSMDLDG